VTDKYALVAEFAAGEEGFPVRRMCSWVGVSASGFYEWRSRPESSTAARRRRLAALIGKAFEAGRGAYGYRRVHAQLVRWGEQVSPELVRAVMRQLGLVACQPRPYKVTTRADAAAAATPDLVGRDFTAAVPGAKLVGDITYLRTWEGWLYLATVIDCHSKRVLGWSMAEHMRTDLICDAITMAATNVEFAPGAVFHSDRGSQYTSEQFRTHLAVHGLSPSIGRTGVCWDNAMAESFHGALKNELVYRTAYPTRRHARTDIAEYIEVFYNRQRLHSALGYRTPIEVHQEFLTMQAAA
jgi:transposase InsO family protein